MAASVRRVTTVHVCSSVPNLASYLSKRLPHIKVIDVPAGCSEEVNMLQDAKVILADPNIAWHPSKLPFLEWLQLTWAGVDGFIEKINPQQSRSYLLSRFGGVFGAYMAQYVIGHIISWERGFRKMWTDQQTTQWLCLGFVLQIPSLSSQIPNGLMQKMANWRHFCREFARLLDEIWRKKNKYRLMSQLSIGILGLGDIGRTVAKTCKSMGMTVWGVGRQEKCQETTFVDHYCTLSNLPELLQSCDYVCNILPSTPATKNLLSGSVLECGKNNSPVFINVGRGDIIDEKSLIHALHQGWISGAILDVFKVEPLPKESALWKMSQVVITPHIAAVTFPEEVADLFVENISLYERGETLKFLVDVEKGY